MLFRSVKLGLTGFILPFFFLNNPILLLGTVSNIPITATLRAVLTAAIGAIILSSGLQGYLLLKLNKMQRVLILIAGLLFIETQLVTDAFALMLFVSIIFIQYIQKKSLVIKEN